MNILTFDIEEWFHLLDNESTKTINGICQIIVLMLIIQSYHITG